MSKLSANLTANPVACNFPTQLSNTTVDSTEPGACSLLMDTAWIHSLWHMFPTKSFVGILFANVLPSYSTPFWCATRSADTIFDGLESSSDANQLALLEKNQ